MKIQSLSVVVPNKKCINRCSFCVSQMNEDEYKNSLDENLPFYDLYAKDYSRRLEFARDNGCNTIMLTGDSEPQQNKLFLQRFGAMNSALATPFRWIEMQTTGVMLDGPYLRFLRNHVGVSTISVSVSSFNNKENNAIINTPLKYPIYLEQLCSEIKRYDFNLRLSINMTSSFDGYRGKAQAFFDDCKDLGANQVTLRVLYAGDGQSEQAAWLKENSIDSEVGYDLTQYVLHHGRALEQLEFGRTKYSVMGMSTVIDDDCMSTAASDAYKYLILRPDCKLYSKWDDKGSLIF